MIFPSPSYNLLESLINEEGIVPLLLDQVVRGRDGQESSAEVELSEILRVFGGYEVSVVFDPLLEVGASGR